MVFISNTERNILVSYLNDFKELTGDDNADEFSDIVLSLYDKKNSSENSVNAINKANDELELFIKEYKKNLNIKLNKNQKLLEEYNQLMDDNRRLTRINNSLKESNRLLDEKIKTIRDDNVDYKETIRSLKKDIDYYERILSKLTLIINSLEDDGYSLNDSLNIDTIESSPYYRLIDNSNHFDRQYYNAMYLNDENVDEITHFLRVGAKLDYNPSEDFDTKWYRKTYLDNDENLNPLVEYLSYGKKHNNLPTSYSNPPELVMEDSQEYHLIDESGLFDRTFYVEAYDVDERLDALTHYLTEGYLDNNKVSEDFDVEWYNKTYPYYETNPLLDYILNSNTHTTKKIKTEYSQYDIKDSQLYTIINENDLLDVSWYFTQYNSYNDDLIEDYLSNASNHYLSQLHKDYMEDNPESDVYQYIKDKLRDDYDLDYDYSNKPALDVKDSVEYRILSEDDLFDKQYYLEVYGDVKKSLMDPLTHYILYGISDGRNPSEEFDTNLYYSQHPDIRHKINPLVDYIYNGKIDLCNDVPDVPLQDTQEYNILDDERYFDGDYYARTYDIDCDDLLEEYLINGFNQKRNPTDDICITSLDGVESINDYINYQICPEDSGEVELDYPSDYFKNYNLLRQSPYFDDDYYTNHNPNITQGSDAIEYYLTHDDAWCYPTSKYFDPKSYVEYNPDLKNVDIDPLIHFIKYGINETRRYRRPKLTADDFKKYPQLYELYDVIYESSLFDEAYYMKNNPSLMDSGEDSIIHYLRCGIDLDLNPSAAFSTKRYLKYNPDIKRTGFNPLYHYIKRGVNENRFIFLPEEYYPNKIMERYDFATSIQILDKLREKTTIILPVAEDIAEFRITLQSVIENTEKHYELILIKEHSGNATGQTGTSIQTGDVSKELDDELKRLSQIENITVMDSDKDYNTLLRECIEKTNNDVVLLDRNVVLTPHWLVKLTATAYSDKQVAAVSAITNNSDFLTEDNRDKLKSIFDTNSNNIKNLNDKSRQLQEKLNNIYVKRERAEKHCVYIKHDAMVGVDSFDVGDDYLDELSKRLYQRGFVALTDSSTFVYACDESENEFDANRYNEVDVDMVNDAVSTIIFDAKGYEKILCFTQMEDNVPIIDDDIKRLSNKYQTYILAIDDERIYLYKYLNESFALIDNIKTDYSYDTDFFYRVYINILINLKVDLIYTKTFKRLFHPTNRKFTSILEFKHHFEVEELHEMIRYDKSFVFRVEELLKTHYEYEDLIEKKINEIDFSDKKVVVYTAVTGSYDEPVIPGYVNGDFDYICFTDNPNLTSEFWDIRLMEDLPLDNIRKVRSYKILAHKYLSDYDYSLWIDTNIELTDNIVDYVHKYSKNNKLLCIRHIERDCLYQEAKVCISSAKDTDIEVINAQMDRYKLEGYPEHNGLISSGVLFRNHNDSEVVDLMEDWFDELLNGSYRDQLSFNYVCWKNNFAYDCADIFIIKNSYMQLHDHMSKGFVLRNIDMEYNRDYDLKYTESDVDNILGGFKKISIVMAADDVDDALCNSIENVIKYTSIDYELLLVTDDADDYDKLNELYGKIDEVSVIYSTSSNKINKVNLAVNHSVNDILILDENTLVSPKYAQKLMVKAYSEDMIASVSPITNNDLDDGKMPYDLTGENLVVNARCVEQSARDSLIISPLVNGCGVFIKRDAIYSAGFFDVEYDLWEYSLIDYSLRLLKKGWHNVIAPSVYVHNDENTAALHEYLDISDLENNLVDLDVDDSALDDAVDVDKSTANQSDIIRQCMHDKKILLTRYYEYNDSINEFDKNIEFNNIKRLIRYGLNDKKSKKRILYVLHDGMGGTLHTNVELMKNINPHMETYMLVTSTTKVELYRYNSKTTTDDANPDMEFKNNLDLLRTWKLNSQYTLLNTSNDRLRQIYFNILVYMNIDIIHIRHLILSTFDLPNLARKMKIPTILSFHDLYYICPSHNLIDDNKNYCGGTCPPLYDNNTLGGQCNIIGELNIPQARTIVHWWRDEVSKVFEGIQAFITTSKSTYNLYTRFYPQLADSDFRIIEHGRDLETPDSTQYVTPINSKDKIKILFPGHIGYIKGYELIKKIKELDVDDRLEFHYMGSIGGHTDLEEIGQYHGLYKRSEFADIVHGIKPHFIGIFSICPETYCHTLTEGWASGIPILAVDIGAVGERIKENGGGFLINNDPQEAYDKIIKISYNRRLYMKKAKKIPKITFKSTEQMGYDYLDVYNDYLNY